eukprot:SAG31_NODE_6063_length_2186_cov_1.771442_2_plen_50_part_00
MIDDAMESGAPKESLIDLLHREARGLLRLERYDSKSRGVNTLIETIDFL